MAKAAWCTVAPTTGNGNKSIAITATAHTGRTARSTIVTVQNQSGTKPSKAISVNQAEKTLYITTISSLPASLPASGAILTITGKSNAKIIRIIEACADAMDAHQFKVNGVLQTDTNGDSTFPLFNITGDPGASSEYTFEAKINISQNLSAKSRELEVELQGFSTDNESDTPALFNLNVVQAGVTSALSTDKTSVSLTNAGTTQNVALTSNDDWIVS